MGRTLDRTALVLRHRRLVYMVARVHAGHGLEIDDLVQEGMCGLLAAADRYDPGRGVRFWTYARYWVQDAICNAVVAHSRPIRVPEYLVGMINRAMARLPGVLGRLPTMTELADAVGVDPATCGHALQALDLPVSLSASGPDDAPLSETLPDPSTRDPESLALDAAAREELRHLLDALPARERAVLERRFGLDGAPHTFEELGQMWALSSARVRQICQAALARLRQMGSANGQ